MSNPDADPAGNVYSRLIQAVVDLAIYMLDLQGRVVSWNPGAERIKGYSAGEIIGEHFSRFYTEEDRAAGAPEYALRTAAETGRFTVEAWRCRKDGSRFWAGVIIDAVYQDGELIGFAKITRDMTEQRNAQLATLESERRFRLLVQGVTDYAIFLLSTEGCVTNWNAGATRIKGYSASEIVGDHFSRFYTPEDIAAGLPNKALETARHVGRYEAEGWRCRKDGSRFWAGVVIEAIYDDGNLVGFAKITRDLTERRNNQIKLEESREQLFHAQKMEAVGQLTGGIAHDFNNLLTAISGSLDLLQRRIAQGRMQEIDRYVTTAKEAAARAAGLTHRLLAFARRQTLEPKKINPNRLIADMKEMIQRTIGPEIELSVTLSGGVWPSLCDPNQLENAILNLCINARDAMPDGGQLTIETVNIELDERRASERDMEPGDYVEIGVIDTGIGMSPAVVARAFDPFYTTKPAGKGTGLGLSMIYGFVKQSGGQVKIFSQLGCGTAVRIWLPRDFGEVEEKELPQPMLTTGSRARDGETVLIVDDEPTVRMLIADVVDELGYAAIEAADAASALKVLQSNVRLDLLITDVGLPGGVNGRQMADAARQHRPGLPVLFITGYAEKVALRSGDLEPGMHVLIKPFAMEDLVSRIGSIIER